MNDSLIRMFDDHPDEYLSGEAISAALNCSRTAVWKQIQRLRAQGYAFDAVPRLGYKLIRRPDKLDVARLAAMLDTRTMGRFIRYVDQTGSTQTLAHEMVAGGAKEGTLIIAEEQTAGRGRMDRKWHSPAGRGIWMSLVLTPSIPLQFTPQLTLLVAVALCRAVKKLVKIDIGIKWPNDLLIGGRKVSGILLESKAEDERLLYAIAGIGISANLETEDYPEELRGIATSLKLASGKEIDRVQMISEFLHEFEALYDLFLTQGFSPIRSLWEALSVSLHCPIKVQTPNRVVEGIAECIDEMGALVVKTGDGTLVKLFSGDVTHAGL